jgi:hypothetical protein
MKRDLIFIAFAVLLGTVISIYFQEPEDNILFEQNGPTAGTTNPEETPQKINYQRTRKSRSTGYDNVSAPIDSLGSYKEIFDEKSFVELDQRSELSNGDLIEIGENATNESGLETVREDQLIDWQSLFDQWKIVFVDSVTARSALFDALSISRCQLTFVYADGSTRSISDLKQVAVAVEEGKIHLLDNDARITLKYLKRVDQFKTATDVLISFCKAEEKPE